MTIDCRVILKKDKMLETELNIAQTDRQTYRRTQTYTHTYIYHLPTMLSDGTPLPLLNQIGIAVCLTNPASLPSPPSFLLGRLSYALHVRSLMPVGLWLGAGSAVGPPPGDARRRPFFDLVVRNEIRQRDSGYAFVQHAPPVNSRPTR